MRYTVDYDMGGGRTHMPIHVRDATYLFIYFTSTNP